MTREVEITLHGIRGSRQYDLDLGDNHYLQYTCWKPDRDLNPQYADIPDCDRIGALIYHKAKDGKSEWCCSGIYFNSVTMLQLFPGKSMWTVQSMEPLDVTPSILCMQCGDHGYIRNGRWEAC